MIPLRRTAPIPTCEACENATYQPNGDVYCLVYREEIPEPTYSAEDCPSYETDI